MMPLRTILLLIFCSILGGAQISAFRSITVVRSIRAISSWSSPFSFALTAKQTTTDSLADATSPQKTTNENKKENVELITVCMGDLCRGCQGASGASAKDIFRDLRGRQKDKSLNCELDTSVCLGNCGEYPIVSIDYKDGSSSLVFGYKDMLEELGLHDQAEWKSNPAPGESTARKTLQLEDPRDRMRASLQNERTQQQSNDASSNPWATAASYLAKKAQEQIFGK